MKTSNISNISSRAKAAQTSQKHTKQPYLTLDSKASPNHAKNHKKQDKDIKTTLFKSEKNLALLCDFYEFLVPHFLSKNTMLINFFIFYDLYEYKHDKIKY